MLHPEAAAARVEFKGMEAATGDVLAWVGGRDFRHSRFDRVSTSRRQTGSAFKPFVYAAALAEGHYLSEHLQDEPLRVQLSRGGTVDLYGGEVAENPIGANVQTEGFDLSRLHNDVRFRDNGEDLDATAQWVPDPVLPQP